MDGSPDFINGGTWKGYRDVPAAGPEGQDAIDREQRRVCDPELFDLIDGIGLIPDRKALFFKRYCFHVHVAFNLIVHLISPN